MDFDSRIDMLVVFVDEVVLCAAMTSDTASLRLKMKKKTIIPQYEDFQDPKVCVKT